MTKLPRASSGPGATEGSPRVAVITATCGRAELRECVESVAQQTHPEIHHYLFIDGAQHRSRVEAVLAQTTHHATVLTLPHSTGQNRFNGHRIYGGAPFIIEEDYVCFLDDDNLLEACHVASLVEAVRRHRLDWAYSLRTIIDHAGNFVCHDDCDSLGIWGSWYGGQHHIDANCYLLSRDVACESSWIWNRPGYSDQVVDPDKALCRWLLDHKLRGFTNGRYSLRYRLGASANSVQAGYFIEGNTVMSQQYRYFPWRTPILEEINVAKDYRRIVALYEPQRDAILRRLNSRPEPAPVPMVESTAAT